VYFFIANGDELIRPFFSKDFFFPGEFTSPSNKIKKEDKITI
jgi:hypothetical protein